MARKHSLFSGGSGSASAILQNSQQKPAVDPIVDISTEAVLKRVEGRKLLPDQPLKLSLICLHCRQEKQFEYDFSPLAAKYPHHSNLLKQLVTGIALIVTDGYSLDTAKMAIRGLTRFIEFLNDKSNLLDIKIDAVVNINANIFQAYKTYLTTNYPSRSTNGKEYNVLTNAVKILRKKFPDEFSVGENGPIPRAPVHKMHSTEGYNLSQLKALIRCCLKDIKAIKKFHADYNALNVLSPQLAVQGGMHHKKLMLRVRQDRYTK